ncbi:hypothetical protein TIFTF001_010425 [Ficus carica]|uniref:Uncharacterized protein n=1 Tax=Ficus carica TaxID=3494 RepID=A0AA87ZWG2_FICCA|nr:hypothetical protein TIFTF001_010425 [Ficus carica]
MVSRRRRDYFTCFIVARFTGYSILDGSSTCERGWTRRALDLFYVGYSNCNTTIRQSKTCDNLHLVTNTLDYLIYLEAFHKTRARAAPLSFLIRNVDAEVVENSGVCGMVVII